MSRPPQEKGTFIGITLKKLEDECHVWISFPTQDIYFGANLIKIIGIPKRTVLENL